MKNLFKTLLLALALTALFALPAMAESDAVSSASVADFYADAALTGDDLMNAINAFSGTYLVSTANPDGTPNTAFLVFSMLKNEDKYYLMIGSAENQTKPTCSPRAKAWPCLAPIPRPTPTSPIRLPAPASGSRPWKTPLWSRL